MDQVRLSRYFEGRAAEAALAARTSWIWAQGASDSETKLKLITEAASHIQKYVGYLGVEERRAFEEAAINPDEFYSAGFDVCSRLASKHLSAATNDAKASMAGLEALAAFEAAEAYVIRAREFAGRMRDPLQVSLQSLVANCDEFERRIEAATSLAQGPFIIERPVL